MLVSALLVELFDLLAKDKLLVENLHHELLVQILRRARIRTEFHIALQFEESTDVWGILELHLTDWLLIDQKRLVHIARLCLTHRYLMKRVAKDHFVFSLLDKLFLQVPIMQALLRENIELLMISLEKVPLNQALKQRHTCEVPEEAPRLLVLLLVPLSVPLQKLIVIEQLRWVCFVAWHPIWLTTASLKPI